MDSAQQKLEAALADLAVLEKVVVHCPMVPLPPNSQKVGPDRREP